MLEMETAIFIILIVSGLIFLAIEFLLVPGFSIPGLAGIAMIIFGVYRAYHQYGMNGVAISLGVSLVFAALLFWYAMKSRSARAIGLEYSQKGTTSVDDYSHLLGKRGKAVSNLRPAGIALIGGIHCDVVTDGEYIEKDSEVVVGDVEGLRIVVTKYQGGM